MLGMTEGRRRRGHQRMRWLGGIADAVGMNLGRRTRAAWRAAVFGVSKNRWDLRLNNKNS